MKNTKNLTDTAMNTTVETIEDVVHEAIDAYICESVDHFARANRSRYMSEDARYFYSKEELQIFHDAFMKAGGDEESLHIGIVYTDEGDFFCYEVCRRKYYDLDKYMKTHLFYS